MSSQKKKSRSNDATDSDISRDTDIKQKKEALDEIDALFDDKKTKKRKAEETEQTQRKQVAKVRAGTSASAKKSKLQFNRNDVSNVKDKQWVDDGMGGKFNKEGYTGRVQEGCKVFKAHLFNKPNFGDTPECPFDCDCCYI